jgi:hypothetical protein
MFISLVAAESAGSPPGSPWARQCRAQHMRAGGGAVSTASGGTHAQGYCGVAIDSSTAVS